MSGSNGKIHIDLSEDGFDDMWLDLRDLGQFSPKDFRAITEGAADGNASGRETIRLIVSAWRIRRRDGTELPAPDDDSLDIDELPVRIAARIKAEIDGQTEEIQNLKARSRRE